MKKPIIKPIFPPDLESKIEIPSKLLGEFVDAFNPVEGSDVLHLFVDARTLALYFECHIRADKLIGLSTTDVPLDPEDQPEYRANRDVVSNSAAFFVMQEDAKLRRTFSNIVAEFTTEFDPETPLKIIGGQHRFQAIKEALTAGINEVHGIKVYFGLTSEQRLDAQLISNTVIAVPADLFDRMQETMHGPELRDWCQKIGLLDQGQDFADKRRRGRPVTVGAARTFILNYSAGKVAAAVGDFPATDTSPTICKTGVVDSDWEALRANGKLWKDGKLETAGREFAALIEAQRKAVAATKKGAVDVQEKALNYAVLSAWAYTAGLLHDNPTRLARHFGLKNQTGRDPLNAAALAKGHHQSDAETYRGLGYRTDFLSREELTAHERGILAEHSVKLTDGAFQEQDTLQMHRLEDRILFICRRFSLKPLDRTAPYWSDFKNATNLRNILTHPKSEAKDITHDGVKRSINSIVELLNAVYIRVYGKKLPAYHRQLSSKLTF